jgi:hypothetical protein
MSYMDPPRIHFSGSFWTDPSTINNATENYSLTIPYNNQPPSATNPNSVWWNQFGKAYFKIPSATVTAAMNPQYQLLTTSAADSIIGAKIVSVPFGAGNPQYGRLVDLDPDQQARSMIVGLKVQITLAEAGVSLAGVIRPMCIIDLWGRVIGGSGGGIESAGCMYQSVIEELEWQGIKTTHSAILKQLYAASPRQLSFKMVVDGYNGQPTDPQFANGRMVGTIGPQYPDEPAHFVAKRRMFTGAESVTKDTNGNPDTVLNNAPLQLNGSTLTVDLGNSVPTTATHGGPFKDVGTVEVVIDPLGSNIAISPPLFTSPQGYAQQYTLTAGIFEVNLGTNASLAANKPLALRVSPPQKMTAPQMGMQAARLKIGQSVAAVKAMQPSNVVPAGSTIGLAERQNGYYADVSLNAVRLEKGAPPWSSVAESSTEITGDAKIVITATCFGVRAPKLPIAVTIAANQYQFPNNEGEPYNINNEPLSTIGWTSLNETMNLVTDPNGQAVAHFVAGDLVNSQKAPRRQILDGQLYLFTHTYSMDGLQPITLLVFENAPVVSNPTWYADVQPVLLQYARLYPFMRSLIDLGSYQTLTNTSLGIPQKLQSAMTLPMTHPAFMPVTRDLSLRNRQLILTWIANGMPEGTPPSNPKPVS